MRVSRAQRRVNQGATIAIDPRTGDVFVAWRRFGLDAPADADGIMVARLPVGAQGSSTRRGARASSEAARAWHAICRSFEHRKQAVIRFRRAERR